jgi:hypothetical protein
MYEPELPPGRDEEWSTASVTRDTGLTDAAYTFFDQVGFMPTPDAVCQLVEVFLPCLAIMCERPYDPHGRTWREGGWRSQLVDIRKKFKRLWYHGWLQGKFVLDHPQDMINYLGFYIRLANEGEPWGDWGSPGSIEED